ncbi:MAG TPA: hypothetical protein VN706_06865 [Gemmatimonadaceae bacterium]|nr:hypothetical protein [Gemmatimonadaceae bacterium]
MRLPTHVRLLDASDPEHGGPIDKLEFEVALAARLKAGDLVLCAAGDVIPATGDIVEGTATIVNDTSTEVASRRRRIPRGSQVVSGYVVIRVAG